MNKQKIPVWRFFASVKVALFTLILLAVTSIIGTVIKQGKAPSFYVQEFGPDAARFLEMLDLTDMYSSWWFVLLLSLFALNLVVCSIERLPGVWRMVVLDNLATDPSQMERMSSISHARWGLEPGEAATRVGEVLVRAGWKKPRRQDLEDSSLLFVQKGAWTRLGVYIVHLSILVILAGAMLGSFFGFKAYVFLPEGRAAKNIFLQRTQEPIPLGFELQCDRFERSFYPNGMVREYRADLSVVDPARNTTLKKSIIVNDPLSYRGITFYQADSFPLEEFHIVVTSLKTGMEQAFRAPPDRTVDWSGTGISFRIEELLRDEDGAVQKARITLSPDTNRSPYTFWMGNNTSVTVGTPEESFIFSFRQLYTTLLLATKDPGVPVLFAGCCLMLLGLAASFLLSHRRIWVWITPGTKQGSRILISGSANKNKPAFEKKFRDLVGRIQKESSIPGIE